MFEAFLHNFAQTLPLVILTAFLIFVYFLPCIIARNRETPNRSTIFVINLFLGWTAIGWIICLAWSVAGEQKMSALMTAKTAKRLAVTVVVLAGIFAGLMTTFPDEKSAPKRSSTAIERFDAPAKN